MKYELIVVWESGEKEVTEHASEEKANSAGAGMKMAFGNQISWWGVRPARGQEG